MASTDAEVRTARLKDQLTYETPFWAGGATRDETGRWQMPAPGDFPGVAKILNKQRKLVHVQPRPWQLEFDDLLEKQRAEGKPMRAIVLKARKLGFSTWIALKFLQRLTMLEYQQAIIVAQDIKTAGVIFDMAKLAHAHLPTLEELGVGFSIRPAILKQNFSPNGRKFMIFGEESGRLRENGRTGDSVLELDTAGAPEAGRGYTPSMLHLSEVARWEGEQASRKMLGLLNAMPYEPETIVVLESTANGLNHFYRRWISARDGANDPDTGETYVALFVPWWRDPQATMLFPTLEDRARFVEGIGNVDRFGVAAEDEEMLIEAYDCSPEQLAWRRMMIRTQSEGSVEMFKQENPSSDEEAFIGSGRTVFGGILVARAIKAAEDTPAPVTGTLAAIDMEEKRSRAGTIMVPQGAVWVAEENMGREDHQLQVWEHPVRSDGEWPDSVPPDERVDGAYVVAVDAAGGEANTFTQGDFHCVQVFDHRTREQVAVHESRMDIALLPLWVLTIAIYYNKAWVAVEVQGPGIAVVDPLQKTYRYPKMYRRRRVDRVRDVVEDKPGWSTDQVTKPVMEATFGAALQSDTHGIRDIRTARQLSTYIINEKGKHEAQQGEHDDRLVTAMIAHRIMEVVRPPRTGKRTRTSTRRPPRDELTNY